MEFKKHIAALSSSLSEGAAIGVCVAGLIACTAYLSSKRSARQADIKVSSIHVYPVKGLRGHSVESAELDDRGLHCDRRWLLVELDDAPSDVESSPAGFQKYGKYYSAVPGMFHTQRSISLMATLCATVNYQAHDGSSQSLPVPARLVDVPTALTLTVDRATNSNGVGSVADAHTTPIVTAAQLCLSGAVCPPSTPPGACVRPVRVWRSRVHAVDQGDGASAWVTAVLLSEEERGAGRSIRLMYMDSKCSLADRHMSLKWLPFTGSLDGTALGPLLSWAHPTATWQGLRYPSLLSWATGLVSSVSFADGYPLLLASTSSLADMNARMHARRRGAGLEGVQDIPMARFRPNIVVAGGQGQGDGAGLQPWVEETWTSLALGSGPSRVFARGVKRCDRCIVTTTDQVSGYRQGGEPLSNEPLATLASYRGAADGSVFFAMNLVHALPLAWRLASAWQSVWGGGRGGVLPTGCVVRVGQAVRVLGTGAIGPL